MVLTKTFIAIDVQGFHVEGKFCPREVALYSDSTQIVLLIDFDLKNSRMTFSEYKEIQDKSENEIGLPIVGTSGLISPRMAAQLLKELYNQFRLDSNKIPYLVCTNDETAQYLAHLDHKFIDLSNMERDSNQSVQKFVTCGMHR